MNISRKAFLSVGLAGAAGAALATPAAAQLIQKPGDWSHEGLEAILKKPARYRQVYDITRINDGIFLNNIKNSLNGLQFSFGTKPEAISIVAGLHGLANFLNFDDAAWAKFRLGEFTGVNDPGTGQPATRNIFYKSTSNSENHNLNDAASVYQDHSIQALQRRGVRFLICHTATEEQSRKLIAKFHLDVKPENLVTEILKHRIPGATVVPSMVATIAVLQQDGHFTYITLS